MRYRVFVASISVLIFSGAGCSQLDYKGYAPTARTLTDTPAVKDYYVGVHARFALDDARPPRLSSEPDYIPAPQPFAATDNDQAAHSLAAGDSLDVRP